ncbi:MAG: hypothetical protein U9R17_16385 [Thermodesulfobacteriota bacterium]|nr:hypothetical protein [Thermodesulfobacteriota bacterium]
MTEEKIYQAIISQINTLKDYSLEFIFSSENTPYIDIESINSSFQQEWKTVKELLKQKKFKDIGVSILFPNKPYDLGIIKKLQGLSSVIANPRPYVFLDLCIAKVLTDVSQVYRKHVSPQLILELLNIYKLRAPEFLIITRPLFHIILDRDRCLSHTIKSNACGVLVNSYESEVLFIFILRDPDLKFGEKHVLFQSLTAFQKIYRKFLELHIGLPEKNRISLEWFGISFSSLKQKRELRDNFSNLVKSFIDHLKKKQKGEATQFGRFLVLRFNNEDILRVLYYEIIRDPDLSKTGPLVIFIYRQIYKIMQEFRKNYISQQLDSEITQAIHKKETENIAAMHLVTVGKVPAHVILKGLPKRKRPAKNYPVLPEFMKKLDIFNLNAIFELYPIPKISQEIVIQLSNIADDMDFERDELFYFIAYMENLLFFLQELEEMDIIVERDPSYGIIKNPYQLNSLNLIQEDMYLGSTGLWHQNTVPPSVIRCISPNAIPNCLGVKERHIFTRISLLTGGFRGSPFDLDSTNRYDWDEEPEKCIFRSGYFQITIPKDVQGRWGETQNIQKDILKGLIHQKQWN